MTSTTKTQLADPPLWQIPPLRQANGLVTGLSTALAGELGIAAFAVRCGFVLLALNGGWGAILYGAAWAWLTSANRSAVNHYVPQPKGRSVEARYVAFGMLVVALGIIGQLLGLTSNPATTVPAALVVLGSLVAWSRDKGEPGVVSALRLIGGLTVAAGGLVGLFVTWTSARLVTLLLPVVVIDVVLLVILVPSVARIGRDLDEERTERVRADERAKVATHLHDSVLQTLTLIQKNAADPLRTAQLARQQERSLRSWLYGNSPPDAVETRIEPALTQLASSLESRHEMLVNLVVVGDDRPLDPAWLAELVAATGEALINVAKHAGTGSADVYAELGVEGAEIYVRDDGHGFDESTVPNHRRGLRDSIRARVERIGGRATIHSTPGEGTEVELSVPYPDGDGTDVGEAGEDGEGGDEGNVST